jgi:N,N'-diacetyllegionaminate synthase
LLEYKGEIIKIQKKIVGSGFPCFIIAEAGINHNSDIDIAKKMIDAAVDAGVDAIKFQTFIPEKVMSPSAPKAVYQKKTTGESESQIEMVRRFQLSFETFEEIKKTCEEKGVMFLSTPFDYESAQFLNTVGVPAFKISSGEITNLPFLEYIAGFQKPIILSTGMSYLSEVDEAVRCLQSKGCENLALLHCVSNYPAVIEDSNLKALHTLEHAFGLPVGYSDHTLGLDVSLASVVLGACILEKHFTLDKSMPGPDHQASLEPDELFRLVQKVRMIEAALGDGRKVPAKSEENTSKIARRSLFLNQDLESGEIIKPADIIALRPSGGIPPNLIHLVLGKRASHPLKKGELLNWPDVK